MRVLQVHNRHRHRGGEDEVVEFEERLLANAGHVVSSLTVDNPTAWLSTTTTTIRAPWNSRAATMVVDAARKFAPDVVHVHNTWFALSPAVVSALASAGFPVVVTLHNFRIVCANGLLLRDDRRCERCVGSHPWHAVRYRCYGDSALLSTIASATIAVARWRHVWSRSVRKFIALDEAAVPILQSAGVPRERITVRPNAVVDPGPRPTPPSESRQVVYAGRLSPEKGPDVLVKAWQRAAPEKLRLTVYGDGPLRTALQAIDVPGVTFAGVVDRKCITQAMLAARALVFPSVCQEAGPLAPIEAAAAGLPLIVSDTVGMSARAERAGAGWTVTSGDPEALCAALLMLEGSAAVDAAGAAARDMYLAHHSPDAALRSLERVYAETVQPSAMWSS